MYPIKITVKCKEFDKGSAQWSLSLTQDECATIMCDTIHRSDAQDITVTAELAAIWTGLQQIRGYQWIEVRCSNSTGAVLTGFLFHQPELVGYESAYRHFKHFLDKHDLMINPDRALHPMTQRVMELNPAIRSRLRRASPKGDGCCLAATARIQLFSIRHPEHPYHIKRAESGQWECNCPDSNAPTLVRNEGVQVCKHLLAAMMDYRLNANTERVQEVTPIRKAA